MTFLYRDRIKLRGCWTVWLSGLMWNDWDVERLVMRAGDSIVGTGEKLDEDVIAKVAERLSYVLGGSHDVKT